MINDTNDKGIVVYDDPARRAERSADIRVDPRESSFV